MNIAFKLTLDFIAETVRTWQFGAVGRQSLIHGRFDTLIFVKSQIKFIFADPNIQLNVIWNIGYYTSPLIVTFLYRRGYFVADSISTAGRISSSIGLLVFVSLCIRSLGRSQNATYMKFIRTLEGGATKAVDKELLRRFDFDFSSWPVDFSVKSLGE